MPACKPRRRARKPTSKVDEAKAQVKEFMDACFGDDAPATCPMTLTVPDGRTFKFNAIPVSITPEPGDLIGFELTVQSTHELAVSSVSHGGTGTGVSNLTQE